MIELTKLNGEPITLNALYIERVESIPDTLVTLVSGKKINVRESRALVSQKSIEFYRAINLFSEMQKNPAKLEE